MERHVRSGVLEASLTVFQQWVTLQYAKYSENTLVTGLLRNTADMRSFATILQQPRKANGPPIFGERNKTFAYPILGMAMGAFEIDTFKAGLKPKHYTNGQMIGKSKEKNLAYFESYRPVKLTVGAIFETDTLDDVVAYGTMLFLAAPRVTLVIESEETGFKTEIGVAIETSLTIPQADFGTPGDPFKFEHSFVIDSYIGVASEMPLIRSVTVNARVGTTSEHDIFNIHDLPALQLMKLQVHELFDKASPNFKYDWKKEREKRT